ncbi:hypothetical protein [Methylocella sp.]|uniref:hypothetical protein n=1 Tax=Methylocella sp. TaxID=1978226 RepID=UPI0035AF4D64
MAMNCDRAEQDVSEVPGLVWRAGRLTLPLPIESSIGALTTIFALSIPFLVVTGRHDPTKKCLFQQLPSVRHIISRDPLIASIACSAQPTLMSLTIMRLILIAFTVYYYIPKYQKLYNSAWRTAPYAKDICLISMTLGGISLLFGIFITSDIHGTLQTLFYIKGLISF